MKYKCEDCEYVENKFIICKNKGYNLFHKINHKNGFESLKEWINAKRHPKIYSEIRALSSNFEWKEIIDWANSKNNNTQWNTCNNPCIMMFVISRLNLCRKFISLAACKAAKFSNPSYDGLLGLNMVENYCINNSLSKKEILDYSFNNVRLSIDQNVSSAMESVNHSIYAQSSGNNLINKIKACNEIRQIIDINLLNEILPSSTKKYPNYNE